MAGTDIYIISGNAPKVRGPYMPTDLTADSEPDFDNWGPDEYWSCAAFKRWHELNVQKYGVAVANAKFQNAYEIAFAFGSYHQECCYDSNFRNYFKGYGISVDTLPCLLIMGGGDVVENVADTAVDVSQGASNVAGVLKWALPLAAIGVGVWAVDTYVYPIFPDKKKRA